MDSSFANLKWLLLFAAAMVAVVSPAGAQRVARSGRPLLLSAPASDIVSSNVPSVTPKAPDLPAFSDTIRASGSSFSAPYDATPQPAPAVPAITPTEVARLQALRDKSKNWAIMTPAEIIGVPTMEDMLGITKRDASGLAKKQSAVERWQDRQQNSRTNTVAANASPLAPDLFGNQGSEWNPNRLNSPNGDLGTPTAMSPSMGNTTPSQNPAAGGLRWPAPRISTPTPKQLAAAEQFRHLLDHPQMPSAARPATSGNSYPAPQTTPDPNWGKSPSAGSPSAPMVGAIGMPARVAPLPGILGQTNAPAAPPSWKPELPPWMSTSPQLGVIPQRKF